MYKLKIEKLINKNLSQRQIGKELGISQSTIRYWLNKFKLKTNILKCNAKPIINGKKYCIDCGDLLTLNKFYKYKNIYRNRCVKCENYRSVIRLNATKIRMIEYKGGECEKCKIKLKDTNPDIFEFHHNNTLIKDRNFSSIKGWNWNRIVLELNKCSLLCANCHRTEHYNINKKLLTKKNKNKWKTTKK